MYGAILHILHIPHNSFVYHLHWSVLEDSLGHQTTAVSILCFELEDATWHENGANGTNLVFTLRQAFFQQSGLWNVFTSMGYVESEPLHPVFD
jgi:hypothetical protein